MLMHGRRSSPRGDSVCVAADDDEDGSISSMMKSDSFCMNQSFPSARNCTLTRMDASGGPRSFHTCVTMCGHDQDTEW